jgi:hypothetical protein
VILVNPLTYYFIHGANLYLAAGRERDGLRRKQLVTAALAKSLQAQLQRRGGRPEVVNCVVEVLQAEADQMRLMLDGGSPWETVRIESKLYEIMHADAPTRHRLFRSAGMAVAALLPPRWFYASRQWVGSRIWYRRVREKIVPVPNITRVARADDFRA